MCSSVRTVKRTAPFARKLSVGHGLFDAGHEEPVLFVSWSPNDQHLLTVSDVTIRLWNPVDGSLAQTYT